MSKKIRLKIVTPNKEVLNKEVDFVLLRTIKGDMGVLPNHEPYTVLLDDGVVKAYVGKKQTDIMAVVGGFAKIQDNEIVIISGMAEPPDELDGALARVEKDRLKRKQSEQMSDLEMHRAEEALRRALVNVDISAEAVIKGHNENFGDINEEQK